ncbi:hypothetical protein XIS1_610045 [Xenorhabdus innexi]|uniref:Uncharacterized protein n=1 Tax=Xenorhabdus innexi TaxID=290109 RepID=A0A1N6N035_9GAMM|nr:hypothetical protein XIS1_610045 [Xenorhabdus innexi]
MYLVGADNICIKYQFVDGLARYFTYLGYLLRGYFRGWV